MPVPQIYLYNVIFSHWDVWGLGSDFSMSIHQENVFSDGVLFRLTPATYAGELFQATVTIQSYVST